MKKKWIKIGSKNSSFLARYNAVYDCINCFMKKIVGMPYLLDDYKYIDSTHYSDSSYFTQLEKLYDNIYKNIGGIDAYIILRKNNFRKNFKKIKHCLSTVDMEISEKELNRIFLDAYNIYAQASSFLGIGTLYTDFLSRKLKKKFAKDYFSFNFGARTKISKYTKELYKISRIKNRPLRNKKIDELLKEYYWLGSFFLIGKRLNKNDILQSIKSLPERKIIKKDKIKLPQDPLIEEIIKLSQDRNKEVEEFMRIEYFFIKLLNIISERIKIDFESIIYMSPQEISDCLLNQSFIPKLKIKKRKKLFGFLIQNGKVMEYCGKKAEFLREDRESKSNVVNLRGVTACLFKKNVRGSVRIIKSYKDMKRFKKGEILVTKMTTPNYIQAIYKSKAIITDDGGLTCHAAIISRELKIPCVIGTKIATKVLKDGDRVEVNADKGVVKKI